MELKYAILGLLSDRPMSGYDLNKAFMMSAAHFWYADQSQIYRTLERLQSKGLIHTTEIPQKGKPTRNEHSLTDAGRAELMAWLSTPLEEEKTKSAFLARLFFIAPLGTEAVLRLLRQRVEQTESHIATLESIEVAGSSLKATLRRATVDYGLTGSRAEIQWLHSLIDSLEGDNNDSPH
ncbi:MAG: PadR family transcriptional regulator [Actinomycetaceae bacterium]|nr:PadR family transcriptional regulator [Actinomycetaceae bacterium]